MSASTGLGSHEKGQNLTFSKKIEKNKKTEAVTLPLNAGRAFLLILKCKKTTLSGLSVKR